MLDGANVIKDDCECGHDRTHHYLHTDRKRYNCLAVHCDCKRFDQPTTMRKSVLRPIDRVDNGPDTPRTNANKPHADTTCRCNACIEWTVRRWTSS